MSSQANEGLYTYRRAEKVAQYGTALIFCIFALISVAALFIAIPQIWTQIASGSVINVVLFLGGILFCFLGAAFFPLIFSNNLPSIRISENGVSVQIFLFWWALVPWEDIQEVRKRPFSKSCLVIVRRLTPVHRLIGSVPTGFRPAFVLKRTLVGFDEAVKAIEQKIEHRSD